MSSRMAALTFGEVSQLSGLKMRCFSQLGRAHVHHDRPLGFDGKGLWFGPLILERDHLLPKQRYVLNLATGQFEDTAHQTDIGLAEDGSTR